MYGAKIKLIRLVRGLTQEEVARRIPVAANTYCKLEQDQRQSWPDDLVEKIALALEVQPADIRNPLPVMLCFGPPAPREAGVRVAQVNEELVALLQEQLRKKDEIIDSLLVLVRASGK